MFVVRLMTVVTVALVAASAPAADPGSPVVTSSGTADIRCRPDSVRAQFQILARGATAAAAMTQLKERQTDVRAGLKKLGVPATGIKFEDPILSSSTSERQAAIQQFLSMRDRAAGVPEKPRTPSPIVVAAVVWADLPLSKDEPEAAITAVKQFQEDLLAADLGGLKVSATEKLPPEQQELADESVGYPGGRGGQEVDPGKPVFFYVATISEPLRNEALTTAFTRARREASLLATAAGADLGDLVKLSSNPEMSSDVEEMSVMIRQGYFNPNQNFRSKTNGADELISMQPTALRLSVTVITEFRLASGRKSN